MKTLAGFLFFLCIACNVVFAIGFDNFPLWNSTWIVAEGSNNRVYPSVLPLKPKKVCLLEFGADNVTITWVNLQHKDFWGTSDVIEYCTDQFSNRVNSVTVQKDNFNNSQKFDMAYQTYDDSVWTINNALIALMADSGFEYIEKRQGNRTLVYERDIGGGIDSLRAELTSGTAYTKEKPVAWARRRKSISDQTKFTIGKLDQQTKTYLYYEPANTDDNMTVDVAISPAMKISSDGQVDEYCDATYYYRKITRAMPKTDNLGYWQLHVYPEIWYYPRDHFTGEPLIFNALKMPFATAMVERKKSLDNLGDNDKKYYRAPFLSDSASVIISFAFVNDGGASLADRDYLWLSGSSLGSKVSFEHYPKKMYNVDLNDGVEKTLALICSDGSSEEEFARTVNTRCPGWMAIDRINGTYLFPLNGRSTEGKNTRDWTVNDAAFMYDGCPCTRESRLGNRTKTEVREYVYKPVPACNLADMLYAREFYYRMQVILTAPSDQRVIDNKLREVCTLIKLRYDNYDKWVLATDGDSSRIDSNARRGLRYLFYGSPTARLKYVTYEKWLSATIGDPSRGESELRRSIRSLFYESTFKTNEAKCPPTWVTIVRDLGL